MELIDNIMSFIKREKWVDIEVFNLRAGGMIRISRDKVQRRKNSDLSQYYYLQKAKETLEPHEFEDIYVGSTGEEVLKLFCPTKGVYLPIKFMFNKLRDLTVEEQKQIDAITDSKEKKIKLNKIYEKMYKANFESRMDTDTLNHLIYKVQKNALRLQGGGMDLATKLSLFIIFMIVCSVIQAWVLYNYFLSPGIDFWNENSADVIKAKELNVEQARLETGYYDKYSPEQKPVPIS